MRPARVLLAIAVVDVVLLVGTAVCAVLWSGPGEFEAGGWAKWPAFQLMLAREATLAAWWSGMVLAGAGVLFGLTAAAEAARGRRGWRVAGPALAGLVLVGLSLDEVGTIHERLLGYGEERPGALDGPGPWLAPVLPGAVLAALAARRLRGRAVGPAAWLGWGGAFCLSTVGLQERAEWLIADGSRPTLLLVAEEGTELLGSLLLVAAGLRLVQALSAGSWQTLREWAAPRRSALAGGGAAVLLAVTAVAEQRLGVSTVSPDLGLPQWWTGSVAAAALAVAALVAARAPRRSDVAAVFGLVGVAAATLSVVHGISGYSWAVAWTSADDADRALRLALAGAMATPAAWLGVRGLLAPAAATVLAAALLVAGAGAPGVLEVAALLAASFATATIPAGARPGGSSNAAGPAQGGALK
jgi:hypothetical protein